MGLAFRGHHESIGDEYCYGGNFLALVSMQAQFDTLLQELLRTPARKTKYLSPTIQNELIQIISTFLKNHLLSKIRNCAFYSMIVDTTSDINKCDQVSIVLRWVTVHRKRICYHQRNVCGFCSHISVDCKRSSRTCI